MFLRVFVVSPRIRFWGSLEGAIVNGGRLEWQRRKEVSKKMRRLRSRGEVLVFLFVAPCTATASSCTRRDINLRAYISQVASKPLLQNITL